MPEFVTPSLVDAIAKVESDQQPVKRGRGRPKGVTKAVMNARHMAESTGDITSSPIEIRLNASVIVAISPEVESEVNAYDSGLLAWEDMSPEAMVLVRKRKCHLTSSQPNCPKDPGFRPVYIREPYVKPDPEHAGKMIRITMIPAGKRSWRAGQTLTRNPASKAS